MSTNGIQRAAFVVGSDLSKAQPWCVWGWDLHERNLRFLERVDPGYFDYYVDLHIQHLDGDKSSQAAVAIRIGYHHALETLFTLLCATVQAPDCIAGWIPKCKTEHLRSLVQAISREARVPNKLGLDCVSWRGLATIIFQYSNPDPSESAKNAERFGKLWGMLAHDFLNEMAIEEFNNLKHGFRVQPGGFQLSVGLEHAPGVLVPGETRQVVGHSRFGSTFFIPERIEGAPADVKKKRDIHFKIREHSLNWDPQCNADATKLAGMSIRNVISFLRIAHGIKAETVFFSRPKDPRAFEAPWAKSVGVSWSSMDTTVRERDITRLGPQDILTELSQRDSTK